jgi:hypothetical protein
MSIAEEEISLVVKKLYALKAAGSDGIPFFYFKMFWEPSYLFSSATLSSLNHFFLSFHCLLSLQQCPLEKARQRGLFGP